MHPQLPSSDMFDRILGMVLVSEVCWKCSYLHIKDKNK